MNKMDNKELYLYNKRRGVEKDSPITSESYRELQDRFPEIGLAQGGLANLMKKYYD